VVLIKLPDEPDIYQEIYVPIENFKNSLPKESDYVSVDIEDNS